MASLKTAVQGFGVHAPGPVGNPWDHSDLWWIWEHSSGDLKGLPGKWLSGMSRLQGYGFLQQPRIETNLCESCACLPGPSRSMSPRIGLKQHRVRQPLSVRIYYNYLYAFGFMVKVLLLHLMGQIIPRCLKISKQIGYISISIVFISWTWGSVVFFVSSTYRFVVQWSVDRWVARSVDQSQPNSNPTCVYNFITFKWYCLKWLFYLVFFFFFLI